MLRSKSDMIKAAYAEFNRRDVDYFIQHVYSFKNDLVDRMDIREAPETDRA